MPCPICHKPVTLEQSYYYPADDLHDAHRECAEKHISTERTPHRGGDDRQGGEVVAGDATGGRDDHQHRVVQRPCAVRRRYRARRVEETVRCVFCKLDHPRRSTPCAAEKAHRQPDMVRKFALALRMKALDAIDTDTPAIFVEMTPTLAAQIARALLAPRKP